MSTDSHSTTLFASHTDTCHWDTNKSRHTLRFYSENGDVFIGTEDGECLGADDGVGVWLMLNMIKEDVPGLYIFHRGEEVGCKGSKWIRKNTPDVLEGIERAISFDRKGYHDVITQQLGYVCASNNFAKALSRALGFDATACNPVGSVTDTAQYTDIIPECTNISVGYFYQHGPREIQNVTFAFELRDRLLQIDFEDFTVWRDPLAPPKKPAAKVSTLPPKKGQNGDLFAKPDKPPSMHNCISAVASNPELVAKYLYYIGVGKKRLEKMSESFPSSYDRKYKESYNNYLAKFTPASDGGTTTTH